MSVPGIADDRSDARRPADAAGGRAGLTVIVADDSILIREGIGKALSARGIVVSAYAEDGEELLRKVAGHAPDAVVSDIRMPPTGTDEGLRAAALLAERAPSVGVLILSDHLEPEYATRLLEDGTPGRGYLLKETITDLDAFADAVRRVAAGESVVDPVIVRHVIGVLRADDPLAELSPREREILELMAEGRSNAAVAAELVISPRTVESHVSSLFGKLGLPDRPDDHRRVLAVLAYLRA
ncbi:MAG: response regulator transcription factor [Solirubrobacteraceae bacterium]